jgi:PadR family transcriptional regulator PadR
MYCKIHCYLSYRVREGYALNIQFKKGALELCVLALLNKKDCYGFELINTLSERIGMSEGTVYPLLKRLKDDDLLTTYLVESSGGPPRKYYRISEKGKTNYSELRVEWREFAAQVEAIIDGGDGLDAQ